MWRLLSKFAQSQKSAIILTTHNMVECEAVCTRVGVMKLGEMVCLGNTQHLRSVHGTGFLLEITVGNPVDLSFCKEVEFHSILKYHLILTRLKYLLIYDIL